MDSRAKCNYLPMFQKVGEASEDTKAMLCLCCLFILVLQLNYFHIIVDVDMTIAEGRGVDQPVYRTLRFYSAVFSTHQTTTINHLLISHFPLSSLVNKTLRYLNSSLTHSGHSTLFQFVKCLSQMFFFHRTKIHTS